MYRVNAWNYFFSAFFLLVALNSCVQGPPVKDREGMIVRASAEIDSLVAVTKELHLSGLISSSDRARVKASLQDALDNLKMARVYLGQGDIGAVEARITIALSIIDTVRGFLNEKRDSTRTKDYPRWVRLA